MLSGFSIVEVYISDLCLVVSFKISCAHHVFLFCMTLKHNVKISKTGKDIWFLSGANSPGAKGARPLPSPGHQKKKL